MDQFVSIVITAICSSNIVAVSGVGAVGLQSEKRNFLFMFLSTLCVALSVVCVGAIYLVVEEFILAKLDAIYLKLFIITCLSCVFGFISKSLIKALSKENYFLYERSYHLPVQISVTIGTLLIINFGASFFINLFSLAMYSVGFILSQIIFYGLYEKLDNQYVLKPARNVPVMLLTLSIFSMILYVFSMMF